jgi:hypothetical protein
MGDMTSQAVDIGAWGRSIAALYMVWYTFFVTANVVVLGWLCVREVDRRRLLPVVGLSVLLSLLTLGSTAMVGYVLHDVAPKPFGTLIVFAAVANALGLFGVIWAWTKAMRRG